MITQNHRIFSETLVCDCCKKPLKNEPLFYAYFDNPGSNVFAGKRIKDTIWCKGCYSFNLHIREKNEKERKEVLLQEINSLKQKISECVEREEYKRLTDTLESLESEYWGYGQVKFVVKMFPEITPEEPPTEGLTYAVLFYCYARIRDDDDPIVQRIYSGDIRSNEEYNLAIRYCNRHTPLKQPKAFFLKMIEHFNDASSLSVIGENLFWYYNLSEKDKTELVLMLLKKLPPIKGGDQATVLLYYLCDSVRTRDDVDVLMLHANTRTMPNVYGYLDKYLKNNIISSKDYRGYMRQLKANEQVVSQSGNSGCLPFIILLFMVPFSAFIIHLASFS